MARKPTYKELQKRIKELEQALAEKQARHSISDEYIHDKKNNPEPSELTFEQLFDVNELQNLQDLFAEATGVSCLITHTDGTPLTQPSSFCRLCASIVRKTEKGRARCIKSDAVLRRDRLLKHA